MPKKLTKSQLKSLELGRNRTRTPKPVTDGSVTFQLPLDRIAELDAIAKSKSISRGAEIRNLLEIALKNQEKNHEQTN